MVSSTPPGIARGRASASVSPSSSSAAAAATTTSKKRNMSHAKQSMTGATTGGQSQRQSFIMKESQQQKSQQQQQIPPSHGSDPPPPIKTVMKDLDLDPSDCDGMDWQQDWEADAIYYISNYPGFPADRPLNYPHLIDLKQTIIESPIGKLNLRAADCVATILYNHDPAALEAFFDWTNEKAAAFWVKEPKGGDAHFLILRFNRKVVIGLVSQAGKSHTMSADNTGYWDCFVQYRIKKKDGKWEPVRLYHILEDGDEHTVKDVNEWGAMIGLGALKDGQQWKTSGKVEIGWSTNQTILEDFRNGEGPVPFNLTPKFGTDGPPGPGGL